MTDEQILQAMQAMLEPIKQDIAGMKSDIGNMKQDISGLKTDMIGVKSDVSGLNESVSDLKYDVKEIKQRVTKIEVVQENIVTKNIQLILEGQQTLVDKLRNQDRIESTLNSVKSDTEVIKGVVTEHSAIIRELKTKDRV